MSRQNRFGARLEHLEMMVPKIKGQFNDERGKETERSFVSSAINNGWHVFFVDEVTDVFAHYDYIIRKGNIRLKVDVKSKTRVGNDVILVEFINPAGRKGWLWGMADAIAFEQDLKYYIVDRRKLLKIVELVIVDELTDVPTPFKKYRTRKSVGVVGVLPIDEIFPAIITTIKK